jgi:transposase InsO family protein
LARVCRAWDPPRATVDFRRHQATIPINRRPEPRRRGPLGAGSDEELVGHIRRDLTESPLHGEGYRKVRARPRYQGFPTSRERVRRLMRERGLQAPQRVGHPHGPKAHDGTILTERPDELWGTDMTTTVTTEEDQLCIFIAVDHCTAECVGIHASLSGNRFEALEPLRQGVREYFGGFERCVAAGPAIRHDHGGASLSNDFQQELVFLGMTSSPSFVREPEGNRVAERFIRTLKENLLLVRHFAAVAELVEALRGFKRRYNEPRLIERHGFRTPSQARAESLAESRFLDARPPCRKVV